MPHCRAPRIVVHRLHARSPSSGHRLSTWAGIVGLLVLLLMLPTRQVAWAQIAPASRADTPLRSWYFAEGNGRREFQTFFTVLNLAAQPASVTVTYQRDDGIRLTQWLGVEANARLSFNANDVVGPRSFGATFTADQDVVVERSNTWGPGQNAETTPGFAPKTMRDWYFAEGTTRGHVTTYFVSQNLSDAPTTVNALFTRDDGSTERRSFTLEPRAREAYRMNDLLQDTAFSAKFSADQDIMMERTILLESDRPNTPARTRTGDARRLNGDAGGGVNPGTNAVGLFGGLGYTPAGTIVGARDWRFAEGSTRRPYETFFVLFNPGTAPATVKLQYGLADGNAPSQTVRLAPLGRLALNPNALAPSADFGTAITSDRPIVVERSYLSSGDGLYGALGFTPPSPRTDSKSWYFAEGATTGGNELYFVLYNLTDKPAQVRASFFGDDGHAQDRSLNISANGRLSVRANDLVPDRAFSSRFLADQDIVVERTRYFSGQSGFTTLGAGVSR